MGLLYNVETNAINYHLKKIFADGELEETSVIRKFRITASDGKDYKIDLLFFHRKLRRLVVVELKIEEFEPEY